MPDEPRRESEIFFESLQSVLDKMVFMIADPVDGAELDGGGSDLLEATMEFSGQTAGRAMLAAQAELCASLVRRERRRQIPHAQ